jgi:hypothetical protein
MSKKRALYTGSAGVHAVTSEFLFRGYNVAQPEVDVGEDVVVIEDETGTLHRVQVKTAVGKARRGGGYQALFSISLRQIEEARTPDLVFALQTRHENRWQDVLFYPRAELQQDRTDHQLGGKPNQQGLVILRLVFTPAGVSCGGVDLSRFRNNWDPWPEIPH